MSVNYSRELRDGARRQRQYDRAWSRYEALNRRRALGQDREGGKEAAPMP